MWRLLLGTAVALAVFALGIFALSQFVLTGRWVHLAQSLVPIAFGGWALWTLALHLWARRRG